MSPETGRYAEPVPLPEPVALLLSLPLAEAAELAAPRAEGKLYMELTLSRLLSRSDMETRSEPAGNRGVSNSSSSDDAVVKVLCSYDD